MYYAIEYFDNKRYGFISCIGSTTKRLSQIFPLEKRRISVCGFTSMYIHTCIRPQRLGRHKNRFTPSSAVWIFCLNLKGYTEYLKSGMSICFIQFEYNVWGIVNRLFTWICGQKSLISNRYNIPETVYVIAKRKKP